MEIIFGLSSPKLSTAKPCALTLGNFDGMHVGHEELVKSVRSLSVREKIRGGLLTFDPHPLKVLAPQKQTKTIFDMNEKIRRVKELGLDFFVIEPFSRELSEQTPEDFFKMLLKHFDLKNLVVGHDFNFGKNRSGSLEVLEKLCQSYKVKLDVLPPVKVNGEIVSSTLIRKSIAEGQVEKAKLLLGRPYFLTGVVEKGAARGRTLGFPTANLFTKSELIPKGGVYVTLLECGGEVFHSVTNIGTNPTFAASSSGAQSIETYILDFNKDIYGEVVTVTFLKFLRSEQKFNSVTDLVETITKDVTSVREFFCKEK